MKKLIFVFFVLVGLCISLFAVFFNATPQRKDFFNYAIPSMPETLDPAKMSGLLEGYLAECVFEGLMQPNPSDGELPAECQHLADKNWHKGLPLLGVAKSYEISDDGLTYTFHLRPTYWILPDGSKFRRVTAHDFVWAWKRVLEPKTASPYEYMLFPIANAYNYGHHRAIIDLLAKKKQASKNKIELSFDELKNEENILGAKFETAQKERKAKTAEDKAKILAALVKNFATGLKRERVIGDFEIKDNLLVCKDVPSKEALLKMKEPVFYAKDDYTLVVKLKNVTPYFLELCAFHTYLPVCRENFSIAEHPAYKARLAKLKQKYAGDAEGYKQAYDELQNKLTRRWWRPENLIYCGPYRMTEWSFQRHILFEPNSQYWDVEHVMNKGINVRIIADANTCVSLFFVGKELDFLDSIPPALRSELSKRNEDGTPKFPQFHSDPYLGTYYYRFNVTRKDKCLNDVWLRRAMNAAIDRKMICEKFLNNLSLPATGFVAKGIPNYPEFKGISFNLENAKFYLEKSRFNANKVPPLTLLYNTSEAHKKLAVIIQQQLKQNLGVSVDLRNTEWKSYLSATRKLEFDIARAGWIGDYVDPQTFLDMFVTDGGNNNTGWSNARYDRIILEYCPDIINYLKDEAKRNGIIKDIEKYEAYAFPPNKNESFIRNDTEIASWQKFFARLKQKILSYSKITDANKKLRAAEEIRFEFFRWAEFILCYDQAVIIPLYYYKHNTLYRKELKGIYKNLRCHNPRKWLRVQR